MSLILDILDEYRIDFAKHGKLEFLEKEVEGKGAIQYRTALDQNVQKGQKVDLQGTLLQGGTHLMSQNQMVSNVSKNGRHIALVI
jgi:hypothetical protein